MPTESTILKHNYHFPLTCKIRIFLTRPQSIDILGYYSTKEDLDNELEAIYSALEKGRITYELQFYKEVDKKCIL